jgi:hypothetical protein
MVLLALRDSPYTLSMGNEFRSGSLLNSMHPVKKICNAQRHVIKRAVEGVMTGMDAGTLNRNMVEAADEIAKGIGGVGSAATRA